MNIGIGLFVIISAAVLRHVYKVKGKISERIFKLCIATGVFMLFSVQTFGNALLIALTAAEIVLCSLLLIVYRAQLIRECEAVKRKRAAHRAAVKRAYRISQSHESRAFANAA